MNIVKQNAESLPARWRREPLGAAWKDDSAKYKKKFEGMRKIDKERYLKEMAAIEKSRVRA